MIILHLNVCGHAWKMYGFLLLWKGDIVKNINTFYASDYKKTAQLKSAALLFTIESNLPPEVPEQHLVQPFPQIYMGPAL